MDKEVIQSITAFDNEKFGDSSHETFEGYKIQTDKQTIIIRISNESQCCESFGSLSTNDNTQDFIGATIDNVYITDESLNTKKYTLGGTYQGECTFLNIDTNKGTLQFVVYNNHNGYYSHSICIESTQVSLRSSL